MIQQEYIGSGSLEHLRELLNDFGARRVFLVTGKGSYAASGAKDLLEGILEEREVHRFSDFSVNPKAEDVERGILALEAGQFDAVIAVGGGSCMDMAKLINFLSVHPESFEPYRFKKGESSNELRPLVAIPTTSGSGSEATSFAVLYVDKTKYSVDNPLLLPTAAIVDPELTASLSGRLTAISGMDALCQGIESYWSVRSTEESKVFASQAIELVVANLADAVNRPSETSRLAMAKAAYLAGKAINISRTTAPHAISYPMTSYFGIPHGQAVAVTVGAILEFNSNVTAEDVQDSRGLAYVQEAIDQVIRLLGATSASEARTVISGLMREIGLETQLDHLQVESAEDIEIIVENGFNPARVKNNPRVLTREALREILNSLIG